MFIFLLSISVFVYSPSVSHPYLYFLPFVSQLVYMYVHDFFREIKECRDYNCNLSWLYLLTPSPASQNNIFISFNILFWYLFNIITHFYFWQRCADWIWWTEGIKYKQALVICKIQGSNSETLGAPWPSQLSIWAFSGWGMSSK